MTAFAEAEKAADWVMQRHPIQLEAAAKLSAEGQGAALTHGSHVSVTQSTINNALWPISPQSNTLANAGMTM